MSRFFDISYLYLNYRYKMDKNIYRLVAVARQIIQHLRKRDELIIPERRAELWMRIEQQLYLKRKKHRQQYLYVGLLIASCVLLAFLLSPRLFRYQEKEDLSIFASTLEPLDSAAMSRKYITLQLANKKEIIVQPDQKVVYSKAGSVQVNEETIGQEESKQDKKQPRYNQLIVPSGKQTQLLLADGSKLQVNAGTRVVYPIMFDGYTREIFVDGEVYLDVAHDAAHPFIVKTKKFEVEVLGTSFNISAYSSESNSTVVLVNGSVNIRDKQKNTVKLAPSQLVSIVAEGNISQPQNVDVEPFICWTRQMLLFNNRPFSEVMKKLSLFYNKEFIYNENVGSMLATGKLDLKETFEGTMRTLIFSLSINYYEENNKVFINKVE